eukprot:GHVH01010795.1.p1 GENE.GHVH01010795.1~~GHVH01010795.1.p1  ORF type:complete len:278 (-),score=39.23 GHVH01010795.1:695-1528(-)
MPTRREGRARKSSTCELDDGPAEEEAMGWPDFLVPAARNDMCDDRAEALAVRRKLERLVKLQIGTAEQPPVAPYVSPAGLWGLHPPLVAVRHEDPQCFFKHASQSGVYLLADVPDLVDNRDAEEDTSDELQLIDRSANGTESTTATNTALDEGGPTADNPAPGAPQLFPALFQWTHGGNRVTLTGSFTDWSVTEAIPMIKTAGRNFSCIVYLEKKIHRYKFIVDDEVWHYCPRQTREVDRRGNVNNVLNMTEFDVTHFLFPNAEPRKTRRLISFPPL